MPQVEFFFDYRSPWSYLAFVRLREAAMRTAAQILWKPLDFGPLLISGSPDDGSLTAAKVRYARKDLADWAEFCGVELHEPQSSNGFAELALRGAASLDNGRQISAFSELVFKALFVRRQDITDPSVIRAIAVSIELDPESFMQRLNSAATKAKIEANAAELVRRGGFGVPTMFVGDNMFYGNDRMPLVELALSRAADRPFVAPGAHGQM
jgi:2-hydroxychromene-2-carboxylate isomerase